MKQVWLLRLQNAQHTAKDIWSTQITQWIQPTLNLRYISVVTEVQLKYT